MKQTHFLISILVFTILKTGLNYYQSFLTSSRKHLSSVLFLTKWGRCLPVSTVSADYVHFTQMVHWQSRSNLKLCYQAVFIQRSNLNIGILLNFPGHSCLHLTSASIFWAASFGFVLLFFLAISRLSVAGLWSYLFTPYQISLSPWCNPCHTVGCRVLTFLSPPLNIKCHLSYV